MIQESGLLDEQHANVEFCHHQVELTFDNWTHKEILEAILPPNTPPIRGFTQYGHMVHVNLREEHLPYKNVIGEVLLEKVLKIS